MPDAYNGDVKIHFEISGAGAALLLLPGLIVDVRDMHLLVKPLAEDRTVVAVDNRGRGSATSRTSPPRSN